MMEMIGFLILPVESIGKQLNLALSFGSGRMESVWGMQLANVLYLIQAVTLYGIAIRMSEQIFLFAGCAVLALALGQFYVVLYLKSGCKTGAVQGIHLIFAAIFIVVLGVFFMGMFGSEYAGIKESIGMFSGVVQKLLMLAGVAGIALYLLGFFMERRYIKNYEVR